MSSLNKILNDSSHVAFLQFFTEQLFLSFWSQQKVWLRLSQCSILFRVVSTFNHFFLVSNCFSFQLNLKFLTISLKVIQKLKKYCKKNFDVENEHIWIFYGMVNGRNNFHGLSQRINWVLSNLRFVFTILFLIRIIFEIAKPLYWKETWIENNVNFHLSSIIVSRPVLYHFLHIFISWSSA